MQHGLLAQPFLTLRHPRHRLIRTEQFSAHSSIKALLEGVTRKLSGNVTGYVFGRLKIGSWQTGMFGRPDPILCTEPGERKLQWRKAEGLASGLGQKGTWISGWLLHSLCCSPDLTSRLLGKCVSEKRDFLKGERLRKEKEREHLRNMNLEYGPFHGEEGSAHPVPGTGHRVKGRQE